MNRSDASGLAYRVEGAGPDLILLHANPGDSQDFDPIVPALARHYRVWRLDWPGYGGSPAPAQPDALQIVDLIEALDRFIQEQSLSRVCLLGNSVGGNVAVRWCLAHPQRVAALVLISSGGFTQVNAITKAFCRLQGSPAIRALQGGALTRLYLRRRNPAVQAMIQRAAGPQNQGPSRAVAAAIWRQFNRPDHDLRQQVAALACPVLVTGGEHDPVIPAADSRRAAALIPDAQLAIYDCGHAPFAECPEAFLNDLLPFLQRHAG